MNWRWRYSPISRKTTYSYDDAGRGNVVDKNASTKDNIWSSGYDTHSLSLIHISEDFEAGDSYEPIPEMKTRFADTEDEDEIKEGEDLRDDSGFRSRERREDGFRGPVSYTHLSH